MKKGLSELLFLILLLVTSLVFFIMIYHSEDVKKYYFFEKNKELLEFKDKKKIKILVVYSNEYPYYLIDNLKKSFVEEYNIEIYPKRSSYLEPQEIYSYSYFIIYNTDINDKEVYDVFFHKKDFKYNRIIIIGKSNLVNMSNYANFTSYGYINKGVYLFQHDFDYKANILLPSIEGYKLECINSYPSIIYTQNKSLVYGCYRDNILLIGLKINDLKGELLNSDVLRYIITFLAH